MSNKRPLPDVIYTRRRVAAVVILIVVIALIVLLFRALGGPKDNTDPAATSEVTTSAETTTQTSTATTVMETTTPTSGASTSTTTTTTNAAANKKTCELKDLEITATSDQLNYTGDQKPRFYATVHNPTGADCEIDLNKNTIAFEVYNLATNERVWSDIDCSDSVGTGTETFKKGEDRKYEIPWSRTGSAPDKCDNRQPVAAGSYYLHALVGDNHSDAWTFNIR
ncbi:hypothetical protein [Corynebacterium pyruviciproducens]|uniref:hypothetical protein n=1 Tax=Corynebacterium pyruviciproducens TaxID=598660 RepID=UPI0023F1B878|nr:hypothetical protein [Corynebacterium pyruviciproducens]